MGNIIYSDNCDNIKNIEISEKNDYIHINTNEHVDTHENVDTNENVDMIESEDNIEDNVKDTANPLYNEMNQMYEYETCINDKCIIKKIIYINKCNCSYFNNTYNLPNYNKFNLIKHIYYYAPSNETNNSLNLRKPLNVIKKNSIYNCCYCSKELDTLIKLITHENIYCKNNIDDID